tara:strand:+ start:203 stop:340 length:138 start_codon:yes stop_codon:yes gene_type:complete
MRLHKQAHPLTLELVPRLKERHAKAVEDTREEARNLRFMNLAPVI